MGAVLLSRDGKQDINLGFLLVQNSSRGSGLKKEEEEEEEWLTPYLMVPPPLLETSSTFYCFEFCE